MRRGSRRCGASIRSCPIGAGDLYFLITLFVMLRTTARPAGVGLFVVALALGVAACGGSDKKAGSSPPTTKGASSTPTTDAFGHGSTFSDLPSDACALL